MPGAYSVDLRQRVVRAYQEGMGNQRDVAKLFKVAPKTLQNYLYLERDTGGLLPKNGKQGRKPAIHEEGLKAISGWIGEQQDITLKELGENYQAAYGVKLSPSMLSRACQQLGLSRKKKSLYASEQDRDDIKKPTGIYGREGHLVYG